MREAVAASSAEFPTPVIVRAQVRFWEKVFGKYPSTTVIIHDANDPGRIVDLIDFTVFGKTERGMVPRADRLSIAEGYVERYQLAVRRFAAYGRKALKFGAIEKRVFKVYGRKPVWLKRLYRGEVAFRAQTGLADDFRNATGLARAYFPYMEKVFREYGVPTKITRLVFVESMFNTSAVSKVGASGIWQFMPATARNYIRVDSMIDERNSVYKATRAAAKLLADNYKILGSWPLAITAYNHGPQGLRQAIKQVGSRDIGNIIANYQSRSFKFASRNFYAEFLAAANVYDRILKAGEAKDPVALPALRTLVLTKPVSIDQLVKATPLEDETLRAHNPCLKPVAFSSLRKKPLPEKYVLHVPAHLAPAVSVALNERHKTYARR